MQNAEDAGAREVNFMLDLNTYGLDPRLLEHPDLAQFQVVTGLDDLFNYEILKYGIHA